MVKTIFELLRAIYQMISLQYRFGIEYKLDTLAFKIHYLSLDFQQMSERG